MLQNKMACQLRTPCDPQTPREHGHCIIRHTPNRPLEQIAAETGIPLKRLTKISAPQGDTHAKPEEIVAVCKVTGRFGWLRFYVRQAGCELFEMPRVTGDEHADDEVLEQTRASLQSLSELVDTLAEIHGDRVIQPDERVVFKEKVGSHQAVIARVDAWVDARCRQTLQRRRVAEVRKATA